MPLSAVVAGNPAGEPLVFMSGYPDNHSVWTESLVPAFAAEGKYKIIVLCLPDYDLPQPRSLWGYTFDEIQVLFGESIEEHVPAGEKLILVAHDWGCLVAQTWADRHSERVKRLVLLDVLVNRRDNMAAKKNLWVMLGYQWWFAAAFLVWRFLGSALGNAFLYVGFLLPFMPDLDPPPRRLMCPPHGPQAWMGYPYWVLWSSLILRRRVPTPRALPTMPTLFCYGLKKRVFFHSEESLAALLSASPANAVKSFDCGHWIMHRARDELTATIKEFLARPLPLTAPAAAKL